MIIKNTLLISLIYLLNFNLSSQASLCDSIKVFASLNDTVCLKGYWNNKVTLGGNPSVTGGQNPYSYQWTYTSGSLSNDTIPNPVANINFSGSGYYILEVIDANGCIKKDSVYIDTSCIQLCDQNLKADAGGHSSSTPEYTICGPGPYVLGGTPTATGGQPPYSYEWVVTQGNVYGLQATIPNPRVTTSGSLSRLLLTITDGLGCVDYDTLFIDTSCRNTTFLNEINNDHSFLIYPNPTNDIINIKTLRNNHKSLDIINMSGQVFKSQNFSEQIDVSNLEKGIYIIRLVNDDGVKSTKRFHKF